MNYIWFDCETGGLNCNVHSLLTAYFLVLDDKLNFVDELDLLLKPSDLSKLFVDPAALRVNKINIEEHLKDPKTVTYEAGKKLLSDFLNKNKIKGKRSHYKPSGHNIQFDKDFIWAQLLEKDEWSKTVHHKTIDTFNICSFLQDSKLIPEDVSRLTDLVEYFNIPMGEAHNAKADVIMNVEVYKAMLALMHEKKSAFTGVSNSNLLNIIER